MIAAQMLPPIPRDEASRLAALASCGVLDTAPEESFDDLARVASELCGTPVALVSLVDRDRQWFKARVRFDAVQTSRDVSFCAHALDRREPLVVPDTHGDPRFADNPLVTEGPRFRFYAGVPLHVDEGSAIGTLCVLDYVPRELTESQLASLRALARQIVRELRLRSELDRHTQRPPPSLSKLRVGERVGERWRIARELGEGGTGVVYEARDDDGTRAAIKVLLPAWAAHPEVVERFVREARVLERVKSAHVGALIDVGNLGEGRGDLPYLVLEYLEGEDLAKVVASRGPLPSPRACAIVADACEGVESVHALGVIHRDLKPSNVFMARASDGSEVVKVLDFGIARLDAEATGATDLTQAEVVIGTPHFMSPEQMVSSHDVDARTDVWSMGVLLYQVVTGQLPFAGASPMQVCANVLSKPPLPIRGRGVEVPTAVEAVVRKCLQKKPDARYTSMDELRAALVAIG